MHERNVFIATLALKRVFQQNQVVPYRNRPDDSGRQSSMCVNVKSLLRCARVQWLLVG